MSSIAEKTESRHHERERPRRDFASKRYSTVALVGPDGSGKSAVAKALMESCPLPLKYLYMGTSIESSNYALPTSRLVHKWKVYRHKKSLRQEGRDVPSKVNLHGLEHRGDRRGMLGGFGRLLRRVSEESYRQVISWMFQLRGNVVLYDRHFLFDACPAPWNSGQHRLTDQIHHWFLGKLYPRPGLVIFLDAPAEVMYARKPEVPVEYLERERAKIQSKSCYADTFVTVDTAQPLEEVVTEVIDLIRHHCGKW